MSLINEALKKAQRQRNAEEGGITPPMPGASGGRVTRRSRPMSSQNVLMIVAGSAVLIVLSVVATIWLLREPAPTSPPSATTTTPAIATTAATPANPEPVAVVQMPAPAEPAIQQTPIVVEPPAALLVTTPPATPEIAITLAPPENTPAAPADMKPDERVFEYLDRLHVLGVRFSGENSRVLMNDRLHRVNDLVDRQLGLRLVEVHPASLVFEDARGVRYTKNL